MLVIHTSVPVDPDRREEALELAETMVERSRAEEGTVDYRAAVDVDDRNVIHFLERYEDESAAAAHARTDHYHEFNSRLPSVLDGRVETVVCPPDGPPEVSRFGAEEIERHYP